jgi:hypothetical protein
MDPRFDIPVFLDFEGVLRPAFSSAGLTQARHALAPLLHAEALGLRPIVVIASTHRLEHSTSELADILESHAPGLGRFVKSSTPYAGRLRMSHEDHEAYLVAPRLFETSAWMRTRDQSFSSWIAIDDNEHIYRHPDTGTPPQLLLCDGRLGFTPSDGLDLSSRFERIALDIAKAPPKPTR